MVTFVKHHALYLERVLAFKTSVKSNLQGYENAV